MLWSWNETDDDTWLHGTFDTREEAIKDALGCIDWIKRSLPTDNPIIYLGRCELVPLRTDPDIDRIMEELDQAYSDDSGCDYYIYEGVTDEERKWLEDKLSDLMFEFHQKIRLNPGWFRVVSMEEINLGDYVGENNIVKCPYCGESYYTELYSTTTSMYFPPIYKNGVNVNPDRNKITTHCRCLKCKNNFSYSN